MNYGNMKLLIGKLMLKCCVFAVQICVCVFLDTAEIIGSQLKDKTPLVYVV